MLKFVSSNSEAFQSEMANACGCGLPCGAYVVSYTKLHRTVSGTSLSHIWKLGKESKIWVVVVDGTTGGLRRTECSALSDWSSCQKVDSAEHQPGGQIC